MTTSESAPTPPDGAPCDCGRGPKVTFIPVGRDGDRTQLKAVCATCAAENGAREKREILARFERWKADTFKWLREEMRQLYVARLERNPDTAWVTAVDARRAYRRMPDTDPTANLKMFGSLFRGSKDWEKVQGVQAFNSDEGNHKRPIDAWRYVGGGS